MTGAGCLPELRKVMSRSASIFPLLKHSWTNLFLSNSNKICFSTINWLLFCSNLACFYKMQWNIFWFSHNIRWEHLGVPQACFGACRFSQLWCLHPTSFQNMYKSTVNWKRTSMRYIARASAGEQWTVLGRTLTKLPTSCSLNPASLC